MSQMEIQILHQDYLLTCPDGKEAKLLEAVERVDQQFQTMRDTSKLRSRERVGVLLAVNLAYENLELRDQLQVLQEQLAHLQSQTDSTAIESHEALQLQAAHDAQLAADLVARLDAVLVPKTLDTTSDTHRLDSVDADTANEITNAQAPSAAVSDVDRPVEQAPASAHPDVADVAASNSELAPLESTTTAIDLANDNGVELPQTAD